MNLCLGAMMLIFLESKKKEVRQLGGEYVHLVTNYFRLSLTAVDSSKKRRVQRLIILAGCIGCSVTYFMNSTDL